MHPTGCSCSCSCRHTYDQPALQALTGGPLIGRFDTNINHYSNYINFGRPAPARAGLQPGLDSATGARLITFARAKIVRTCIYKNTYVLRTVCGSFASAARQYVWIRGPSASPAWQAWWWQNVEPIDGPGAVTMAIRSNSESCSFEEL